MKINKLFKKLVFSLFLLYGSVNLFSQGEWEYGINNTIGTLKTVSIGKSSPDSNIDLDMYYYNTYGGHQNLHMKTVANGSSLVADIYSRHGTAGTWSSVGYAIGVYGLISNVTTLKGSAPDKTASLAGGDFSVALSDPSFNLTGGANYYIFGCKAALKGSLSGSLPPNKIFAGLYAIDEIKDSLNTWAGYFDGNVAVEGNIRANEIKIESLPWSDFVFSSNYRLRSLGEVENFIKTNNHLPDIPSEDEVKENGISLGDMDAKLLQKIEELTLYVIAQEKKINELESKLESMSDN